MDQIRTGSFLKELRKEKGLTQSQLAERFNVSDRTVSRWETGSNMPDLGLLVELADFYDVDIKDLINGERKSGNMEKEEKETLRMVAVYAENEKQVILKQVRDLDILGIIVIACVFIISAAGWNHLSLFMEILTQCLYGFILGIVLMNLMHTTGLIALLHADPKKRRIMKITGIVGGCIVVLSLVLSLIL